MSDEAMVKQMVEEAKRQNQFVGLAKWCYYMSFAWLMEPKKAHVNWELTKEVWNNC